MSFVRNPYLKGLNYSHLYITKILQQMTTLSSNYIKHTSEILLVCTHYELRQVLILLTNCMAYVAVPFAVEERSGTITVVDDISKFEHLLYDFEAVVTGGQDLTLVTNVTIHVVDDDRGIGMK